MQILKEEVRRAIIDSATSHFMIHGIEATKMRDVAKDAEVTVGNVYRYFPNKEALVQVIISPALKEINELLANISDNVLSFEHINCQIDNNKIIENIQKLTIGLVDIYHKHTKSMRIISENEMMIKEIHIWLTKIFSLLLQNSENKNFVDIDLISNMYSASVISAIKTAFSLDSIKGDQDLKKNITYYLMNILKGVAK